jgi:hypothetical protein
MPILGIDDQGVCRQRALDLAVCQRHDLLALADVEAALGIGEVVLHVDDDQRHRPVVVDHCTALLGDWLPPSSCPARMRSGPGDLLRSCVRTPYVAPDRAAHLQRGPRPVKLRHRQGSQDHKPGRIDQSANPGHG